jgi:hypothetical protein
MILEHYPQILGWGAPPHMEHVGACCQTLGSSFQPNATQSGPKHAHKKSIGVQSKSNPDTSATSLWSESNISAEQIENTILGICTLY